MRVQLDAVLQQFATLKQGMAELQRKMDDLSLAALDAERERDKARAELAEQREMHQTALGRQIPQGTETQYGASLKHYPGIAAWCARCVRSGRDQREAFTPRQVRVVLRWLAAHGEPR